MFDNVLNIMNIMVICNIYILYIYVEYDLNIALLFFDIFLYCISYFVLINYSIFNLMYYYYLYYYYNINK